jgi:hypothetical protein
LTSDEDAGILMTADETRDISVPHNRPAEDGQARVQCPNCCRMAPVVRRDMGLLFFRCELCLSVGAVPEDAD